MNQPNKEIKALWMAQYLGQIINTSLNGTKLTVKWITRVEDDETDFAIILRTIDQLTDPESLIVYNFFYPNGQEHELDDILRLGRLYTKSTHLLTNPNYVKQMYDYLRAIGILLPFTYLDNNTPVTLTPSDLISLGWAVVKKRT